MAKRTAVTIIILIVLLLLAAGYIGFNRYQAWKLQTDITIYQQGLNDGYQQAIVTIMQQAATCQEVPLYAGNASLTLKAVGCT